MHPAGELDTALSSLPAEPKMELQILWNNRNTKIETVCFGCYPELCFTTENIMGGTFSLQIYSPVEL